MYPSTQSTATNNSPIRLIHQLVERTAQKWPERVAVRGETGQLTYRELDDRADALAAVISRREPDARWIGINTHRSIDMVVGVLAILKAGKAYLPLDLAYPDSRLRQIVVDSGLKTCLTPTGEQELFAALELETLLVDRAYPTVPKTVHPTGTTAYVLYTSGSTGTPKGVCMGHEALVNLLDWQQRNSRANEQTRTLQFAPLTFDVSFQEIFATLGTGGTLLLINDELRLDLDALLTFIREHHVNRLFLPFVALQALAEAAVTVQRFPASLTEVMTAGEQLKCTPQVVQFFSALPGCTLFNQYGPTECHVVTQLTLTGDPQTWPALPSIGSPIDGVYALVLNEQLEPLPEGQTGELCFGEICTAEGYLNRPELTAEKFITLHLPELGALRVYRTGDLGGLQPGGTIAFQGRRDDQVKIRGHRVELGEVEAQLSQVPGIQQAVVVARERAGTQQLVAYLVADSEKKGTAQVRTALEQRLPDYMLPSAYVWLDRLPNTSSGKVDRKRLPTPQRTRSELATAYRKPRTPFEKLLADYWADWLQLDKVGLDDNFFEMGGNSLLAQKTVSTLNAQQYALPITKLYQFPTIAALSDYLDPKKLVAERPVASTQKTEKATGNTDVAIIGMAGRFPGADSIDGLWELLKEGRETTQFFTDDELDTNIPASLRSNPAYVKARGILPGAECFDASFFGLTPNVAQLMDPQQRLFLEIAWETLEQTGYLPQLHSGSVGVFAGCGNNTYYLKNVQHHPELVEQVGAFQVMTLNEKDYIASRTAYQLNLKGPAVSVYSACSTSLLAIAQAVQSLRNGQCELALAGGVSLTSPIRSGHLYQEGAMFSPDGHTRPFDANAQGTVFSDGAGVVLLKQLDAARRDGDPIYGVIKGIGVNNDGAGKGSFSAPSANGQATAIAAALTDANVAPATISYVEAHGTATPVGDPIEIEGLVQAFGPQDTRQFCAIGSIKSNMGHLTHASGVAGLIKTVLAMQHRLLPPSINFATPNPAINFADSPFYVNAELTDWQPAEGTPRRAGVSSFGVGGTNVHVVLEEAISEPAVSGKSRPVQLVSWSARTANSAETYANNLADALTGDERLADVAYTLQSTRVPFRQRRFVVAEATDELVKKLREPTSAKQSNAPTDAPDEVVFLFPGQGAQFLNMGRVLYEQEPVYRQAVDTCADLLKEHLDTDIRGVIYADAEPDTEQRLRNTRYTQPALFVTEYALAQLWMSWGIQPTVFCGHSIGEFVGAHLAGVFSLPDALRLIASRGRMVSELPNGRMLSVRKPAALVAELLPESLSMAAINSHTLCVVAGPDEDVADFARLLDERDIPNQPLATSHAFHSAMMDSIVKPFAELVRTTSLQRPQKPVVSTVSGTWLTDEQATDPAYWANHLRATVRFADALDTLFAFENSVLLEVGPGHVTTTLARQQAGKRPVLVLAGLPTQTGEISTYRHLLTTLGQLFQTGLNPDWVGFYAGQQRRKLRLPTYAFERKRCWVDPVIAQRQPATGLAQPLVIQQPLNTSLPNPSFTTVSTRTTTLLADVNRLLEDASGIELDGVSPETNFLELGFDSLLLTQVALTLKKEFGLPITFRQLTSQYTSPAQLAAYLNQSLPADSQPVVAPASAPALGQQQPVGQLSRPVVSQPTVNVLAVGSNPALNLIAQQLQLLAQQIDLLQHQQPIMPVAPVAQPVLPAAISPSGNGPANPLRNGQGNQDGHALNGSELTPEEKVELKKPFGATARIERQASELSAGQQHFLSKITDVYNRKTAKSKAYAQTHRAQMADPRVVTGFRPLTKEIVYPLVVNKSKGSHLWDIDGNEYIDALNGFGSNMFGYQPDWIKEVLHEQIENGYEVGPQHELAGEVSALICELTGADRAALCNTGSEAVLGAMRIARTVTGRSLIVAFTGSYHGIVDEVLVRGTKKFKSFPAAPGIMPESVQNMLILDYGTEESLRIIRERAHELAAVLVEPVQSRRPEFVPIEFLKQVRTITEASGTALIFDEVITGFRTHPGGAQALFGIRADLGTYGKVVGAGLPIGVIAGKRSFMDALDGGFWQYGDASVPEVGVTYFAGTFVRHPLALAAAKASLTHLKKAGPALQQDLTRKTQRMVDGMNNALKTWALPVNVVNFGSLWKIKFYEDVPYGELVFTLMRGKGIHIWDGFPCFVTEAHTEAELEQLARAFSESLQELFDAGFYAAYARPEKAGTTSAVNDLDSYPPVPGARMGRDQVGNPAWFVPNPDQPGKYMQVALTGQ